MKTTRTLFILIVLTLCFQSYSQTTYYSRVTGNWNSTATWSTSGCGGSTAGQLPGSNDNVVICNSNTVTIQESYSCGSLTVQSGGTLSSQNNGSLTVNGNSTIAGIFTMSNSAIINLQNVDLSGGTISGSTTPIVNIYGNLSIYSGNVALGKMTLNVTGTTSVSSGASVTLTSNSNSIIKTFTGLVTNDGTFTEPSDNNLVFQGGITNTGSFTVWGATFNTNDQTISNSGTMIFNGNLDNNRSGFTIASGITVTNSSKSIITITNSSNSYYGFNNAGTFINQCGAEVTIIQGTFVNTGTIQGDVTAGSYGTFTLASGTFTNISGNIGGDGSYLAFNRAISNGTVGSNVAQSSSIQPTCAPLTVVAITASQTTICAGTSITLTASVTSGGTSPYSYIWDDSSTNAVRTIAAGPTTSTTYTVTVTDSNNIPVTQTQAITVNPLPTANITIPDGNNYPCSGASTILSASGGTSYLWSDGSQSQSITVSPTDQTVYTVTVTDANGCTNTASSEINVIPISFFSSADAGPDQAICVGQQTTLSSLTGNGNIPWRYFWSSGQTDQTVIVSPTVTTTYTLTVAYFGCSYMNNVVVTVNPLPTVNITIENLPNNVDNVFCYGSNAILSASPSDVNYSWSTGGTTQTVTVIPPPINMTYSVTITDINGCTASNEVAINTSYPRVSFGDIETQWYVCPGQSITLTATPSEDNDNLSPTYSFLWDDESTSNARTVAPTVSTVYSVTIENNFGCTATAIVGVSARSNTVAHIYQVVSRHDPIDVTGTEIDICQGGAITVEAQGAEWFGWSTGDIGDEIIISPTVSTTYIVTAGVTDGCPGTSEVMVRVNPLPIANISGDNTICAGSSTTLSASGGVSYLWSDGSQTQVITVTPTNETDYQVTVTDANYCKSSDQIELSVAPTPFFLEEDYHGGIYYNLNQIEICEGQTINFGVVLYNYDPYGRYYDSYIWSTGDEGSDINVSPSINTTYTITAISYGGGCTSTQSVNVIVDTPTNANITIPDGYSQYPCFGASTVLSASEGDTYLWSNGLQTQVITVTPTIDTDYSVTVTSAGGCTAISDLVIYPINFTAEAGSDQSICLGDKATLSSSTGSEGIYWSYYWGDDLTGQTVIVSPTITTTYTLTVMLFGCTNTDNVVVTVNSTPLNLGPDKTICSGSSVILGLNGGANTDFSWNTGQTTPQITVSPTETTTYTFFARLYDEYCPHCGCLGSAQIVVYVNQSPIDDPVTDKTISQGESVILSVSGNGNYSWNIGSQSNSITVSPSSTTTYTINASNSNCTVSDNIVVNVINSTPDEPVVYQNPIDVNNNRSIDISLPVGTIQGSADVSSSGAATYSIPINIPPGTGGMVPQISINYNSQSGNNIMGMGWGVSGLSAITRVPQNFYDDEQVRGINMDINDRFALDGNRLILISGTYGAANTVYGTESEIFSQITSIGSTSGNGPESFEVKTKDGKIMEYGTETDSRISDANNTVLVWKLKKVTDQFGNYILYNYTVTNNESYPASIQYTGNSSAGVDPYNSIIFSYGNRNDQNTTYEKGISLPQTVLLNKISVTSEGSLTREYDFNYLDTTTEFYTHLSEIIEKGSDGKKINSTIITWGQDGNGPVQLSFNNAVPQVYNFYGDFNGDGITEYIEFDSDGEFTATTWYLKHINGDLISSGLLPKGPILFDRIRIGDFNGDGKDDFIICSNDIPGDHNLYYTPYISTGTNFNQLPDFNNGFDIYNESLSDFIVGDFDGDGISECFFKNKSLNSSTEWVMFKYDNNQNPDAGPISLVPTYNGFISQWGDIVCNSTPGTVYYSDGSSHLYNPWTVASNLYEGDFNGDGKTDILVVNGTGSAIYSLNDNNTNLTCIYTGNYPNSTDNPSISLGDFNGDGKSDILAYVNSATNPYWEVKYSDGISFIDLPNQTLPDLIKNSSNSNSMYYTSDFNGDGKSDILQVNSTQADPTLKFRLFLSKGDGNWKPQLSINSNVDASDGFQIYLGDINGDGLPEIIFHSLGLQPNYIDYQKSKQKQLVQTITDGFNRQITFNHSSLTDPNARVYSETTTTSYNYPLVKTEFPLYVVKSLIIPDGSGSNATINYTYQDALLHLQGKGFLGFTQTTAENTTTKMKTTNTYTLEDTYTYFTIQYAETQIRSTSTNSLISDIQNTFKPKDLGSKRVFNYLNQTIEKKYEPTANSHTTTTTSYIYNDPDINYGNLSSTSTNANSEWTFTTSYTYTTPGTWWCPSKVLTKTVTSTKTGQEQEGSYKRTTSYTYNDNGSIATKTNDPDLPINVTDTYLYDQFGNVSSISISGSDFVNRTTTIEYNDGYGRFATKATNALNQVIFQNTYDGKNGNILNSQDINNLVTSYSYDGFGRLLTTTLPTGKAIYNSINWSSSSTNPNILYYTSQQSAGTPTVLDYKDFYGRSLYKNMTSVNGKPNYTITNYNSLGLVGTIETQLDFGISQTTSCSYDNYGRPSSAASPSATITYNYNSSTTTITNTSTSPPHTKTQTIDGTGKIVSVIDGGGEIDYTYYNSGLPKQITTNGSTVSMNYDPYGNQISLNDPNAGNSTYTYNSLGELLTQTDAKNNKYTWSYDQKGRVLTKLCSDGSTISYTYDSQQYGLGKLSSVNGSNNMSKSFTYDQYSRLIQLTENIEGTNYPMSYGYDNISGQVNKITYSSGFAIDRVYDNYGYLKQLKRDDNSSSIWQISNTSGTNQSELYGNGLTTTRTYDQYGLPSEIAHGNVMDLVLNFDRATGNLTYRKDNLRNLQENFTYDNLDRLTSWSINGGTPFTIGIANNGNITTKFDVGNYTYGNGAGPNAVTSVTNSQGVISSLLQDITYTPFNKVKTITEGSTGSNYNMSFVYGVDDERKKVTLYQNNNVVSTTYYLTGYEKEVKGNVTKERHYIYANGIVAMFVKETGQADKMYYVYTDHLGSFNVITDAAGNVVEERNFDAWGRQRNDTNWTYNNVPAMVITQRGFTGHEHLAQFNLINMNGRVYDPVLGRFLSPDNQIQSPDLTQSYNRYSYCINNPLKYTDPSGNNFLNDLWNGIKKSIYCWAFIHNPIDVYNWLCNMDGYGGGKDFYQGHSQFNTNMTFNLWNGIFPHLDLFNSSGGSNNNVTTTTGNSSWTPYNYIPDPVNDKVIPNFQSSYSLYQAPTNHNCTAFDMYYLALFYGLTTALPTDYISYYEQTYNDYNDQTKGIPEENRTSFISKFFNISECCDDFKSLKNSIDAGDPVLANMTDDIQIDLKNGKINVGMHDILIIGYNSNTNFFIYIDPSDGQLGMASSTDFELFSHNDYSITGIK